MLKVKLVEEKETAGVVCAPVPVTGTTCGLPAALSLTVTVPLALPETEGVKVTLMVQLAPAATVAPQLFVCAKFALAAILEIVSAAVPLLESVRDSGWLVVPSVWLPKFRLVGKKETPGEV